MSSNPIPESVRREAWNLLRPYRNVKIPGLPFVTLNYVLHRLFGSDKGNPNPGS